MLLTAGYSNVAYLKSRLMPGEATDDTDADADLAALGKSVAGKFDKFCGRSLTRQDQVDHFTARATAWVLTRYPVEAVEKVELLGTDRSLKEIETDAWSIWEDSGVLETDAIPGGKRDQLVVTYTGGYWLDPRDGTALPAEANALPDEILEAWVQQCQYEVKCLGSLGAKSYRKEKGDGSPAVVNLKLLDGVKEVLNPYRRIGGE